MIDRLSSASPPVYNAGDSAPGSAPGRKVLRMVTNDRTAGAMPKWENAVSAEQQIEQDLSLAQTGNSGRQAPETMLAYQADNLAQQKTKSFGFADLLDMVNPLQHIPVVGHVYRNLTGDEINPMSRLVGGTVFGGPAGFVSGAVNAILEKETGRDMTGNALSIVTREERPAFRTAASSSTITSRDLPGELLAFADLSHGPEVVIESDATESDKSYWNPPKRPIWERD
jgi:hypothetical protein